MVKQRIRRVSGTGLKLTIKMEIFTSLLLIFLSQLCVSAHASSGSSTVSTTVSLGSSSPPDECIITKQYEKKIPDLSSPDVNVYVLLSEPAPITDTQVCFDDCCNHSECNIAVLSYSSTDANCTLYSASPLYALQLIDDDGDTFSFFMDDKEIEQSRTPTTQKSTTTQKPSTQATSNEQENGITTTISQDLRPENGTSVVPQENAASPETTVVTETASNQNTSSVNGITPSPQDTTTTTGDVDTNTTKVVTSEAPNNLNTTSANGTTQSSQVTGISGGALDTITTPVVVSETTTNLNTVNETTPSSQATDTHKINETTPSSQTTGTPKKISTTHKHSAHTHSAHTHSTTQGTTSGTNGSHTTTSEPISTRLDNKVNSSSETTQKATTTSEVTQSIPTNNDLENWLKDFAEYFDDEEDDYIQVSNTTDIVDTLRDDRVHDVKMSLPALIAISLFGLVAFIVITILISKIAVDAWRRRHYNAVDKNYLVDGMYKE